MESAELAAYRNRLREIWDPAVEEAAGEEIIRGHLPLLEQLDQVEGSSVALLDLRDFHYRFLTRRLRLAPPEAAVPPDDAQAYFFGLISPGDLEFVMETTEAAFSFLADRRAEERPEFRLCFEFHIRAGDLLALDAITAADAGAGTGPAGNSVADPDRQRPFSAAGSGAAPAPAAGAHSERETLPVSAGESGDGSQLKQT